MYIANIGAKNVFYNKILERNIEHYFISCEYMCISNNGIYFIFTAFCRKLRFITIGFSMTQFFGESMSISIANKSLHAISITEIFIMKKKDGQFYRITIKKFEDPLIINPWQISNIKMDAYTYILEESGERFDHSDIHMNSVIGINTGTENMVC